MSSDESVTDDELAPYDGVLLVSFGGPEGPQQVLPFLHRVTAGRGVPPERLEEVAAHYLRRGGVSPLPQLCRDLAGSLHTALAARGVPREVLVAQRHTPPSVLDALRTAHERGMRRLVTVVTSAHPSYSGCRQYREDLAAGALAAADEGLLLELDKLGPYAATPAFRDPLVRLVGEAVSALADQPPEQVALLYVTHSIPLTMDELSGPGDGAGHAYSRSHLELAEQVTAAVEASTGRALRAELVFCSRSGPPSQPWLEPDIGAALREVAQTGVRTVVVVPIGFISDHMEVVHDLDTEAAGVATQLGLRFVRVPTVGTAPEFVDGLVDLLLARAAEARVAESRALSRAADAGAAATPADGSWPAVCRPGCCPNLREHRPALCGSD